MRLTLTPVIRQEWQVRCIGDVVPALADYIGQAHVDITAATAAEIAADCRFQADPRCIDHAPGVRLAYSALMRRLESLFPTVPEIASPALAPAADQTDHGA